MDPSGNSQASLNERPAIAGLFVEWCYLVEICAMLAVAALGCFLAINHLYATVDIKVLGNWVANFNLLFYLLLHYHFLCVCHVSNYMVSETTLQAKFLQTGNILYLTK
jgi:hypothetical protein